MNPHDILIKPIITERSMVDAQDKRYTFQVSKTANKYQIKDAVESVFGVKVVRVSTMNMRGKLKRMGKTQGRRPDWKKAIVILSPESKEIKYFEGM
ncbi:MAG: 50S ribosomal protein L23 [Anaerofustis sp.]